MISTNFEKCLVPENNGKQNRNELYFNKFQNDFGFNIVRVDDQFSKPFKLYLNENVLHNAITNVFEKTIV